MVNVTWVSMTDIFAEPLALTESQNYGTVGPSRLTQASVPGYTPPPCVRSAAVPSFGSIRNILTESRRLRGTPLRMVGVTRIDYSSAIRRGGEDASVQNRLSVPDAFTGGALR